jgi:hypothetical protein
MTEILRAGYQASIEGQSLTFDEGAAKQRIFYCVSQTARNWAGVAVKDDVVEGFLCAVTQPVYGCAVELETSDLWWYATGACSKRDKYALMLAYVDWAKAHPKIKRAWIGATKIMGDEIDKAEKVLEHIGMERWGSVWRMEV